MTEHGVLITFDQVVTELQIAPGELNLWIEQSWVLPSQSGRGYLFDSADIARVRLIAELRQDLDVNEEAIPVVLRLLDQVHALRRALDELQTAIRDLPEDVRTQIEDRLTGPGEP